MFEDKSYKMEHPSLGKKDHKLKYPKSLEKPEQFA
jgi:hypothetical protein